MTKNLLIIIGVFLTGIVGGIFSDQILWPYFIERPLFLEYDLERRPVYITEEKEIHIEENVALREAIKKLDKAVVLIRAKNLSGTVNGTGVVVTSDGLVLTVSEAVPQDSEVTLISKERSVAAEVIKRKDGLVLLKAEGDKWSTVGFANSSDVELGQRVFFLGTFLDNLELKNIVNEGILKYVTGEEIETNISDENILAGSPLFDLKGNLVGMKSITQDGTFVVPISKISEFSGF